MAHGVRHELQFVFFTRDELTGKVVASVLADVVNKMIGDAAEKGLVMPSPTDEFGDPRDLEPGERREELYGFGADGMTGFRPGGLMNSDQLDQFEKALDGMAEQPDEQEARKPIWTFPKPEPDELH